MLDSLKKGLDRQQGEQRLNTLLQLAYFSYEYDIEKAHQYAKAAYQEARKNQNALAELHALSLQGEYYYNINDFKTARTYFRRAESVRSSKETAYTGYNYILWANTYKLESLDDSAWMYYQKGLPLLESGENPFFLHYAYINYAGMLMSRYRLEDAASILEKALMLAKTRMDDDYVADIMLERAQLYNLSDEYLKAQQLLAAADNLIPEKNFSYARLMYTYYLGHVEYNLGNFNKAIACLKEILSEPETGKLEDIKANIYALIGRIYVERGEYEPALKYYLDAAGTMNRLHMKRELGRVYSDIAWLYFKQFNDPEAIGFIQKAQAICLEIKDDFGLAHTHSIMGSIHTANLQYSKSIAEHQQAFKLRQSINSRSGMAESLYNLSTVYDKMGSLQQALNFASQSLAIDEALKNHYNLGWSLKRMAELSLKMGKTEQAWQYLNRADTCARQVASLDLRRSVDLLYADWYEQTGDLKSALLALRKSIETNDSIYNVLSLEKTAEIRGLFDLENIETYSQQNKQQLELQKIELQGQQNRFVLFSIILVLISCLLIASVIFFIVTRRQNRLLKAEIAERKKAEQQILKSQIQYEEAQSLAHVGSWEFNLHSQALQWSKETYEIFELHDCPDALLYQKYRERIHPDELIKLDTAVKSTLETGQAFHLEHRILFPDNRIKYISCIGEAVKNENGEIVGLRGTDQDVTLQKQADLAKSEFLSIMSHEIRTPINGVIGVSNLLLHEKLTQTQKEYVNTLHFSANHLANIVSDILDFSKIETGNLTMEKVPFNLHEVVENVFKLFENKALEKHIQYTLHAIPDSSLMVNGDYFRLSQILSNLLSNAVKFTDQGAVSLTCSTREQNPGTILARFEVQDSGIGIDPTQQEKIFDKFSQANVSINRKFGGTGLGLAICKKLVELQGGAIEVSSALGEGALFVVEIPFEVVAGKTNLAGSTSGELNGLNVLVVEDNMVNILILTRFLGKWSAHFTLAKDGYEALNCLETAEFDVVLMDIQMPGLDGRQTTKIIRNSDIDHIRQIPVIAFTAESGSEVRAELSSLGFDGVLSKPFQPDELLGLLKSFREAQDSRQTTA